MQNVFEIAAAILASLGGGVLVVAACSKWLGDVWAKRLIQDHKKQLDQELESYKVRLKKSEFLFQKEFEAASELVALIREMSPTYRFPEMEWADACDDIADDFGKIEKRLNGFLAKHGAVLSAESVEKLSRCMGIAAEGKFHKTGPEPSYEANKMADELYNLLGEAEKLLVAGVQDQSSL